MMATEPSNERGATSIQGIETFIAPYEHTLFALFHDNDESKIHGQTLSRLASCLGIKNKSFASGTEFDAQLDKVINKISAFRTTVDDMLKTDSNRATLMLYERVRRIHHTLQAGRIIFRLTRNVYDNCLSRNNISVLESVADISDQDLEQGELSNYQQLLTYLLSTAQQRGYTKSGDTVYERVRDTRTGKNTAAWKAVCSIPDFVYKVTARDCNFSQWINITQNVHYPSSAASYMQNCVDQQFPVLKKDRHLFAFADGIYVSYEDKFYPHESVPNEFYMRGTARYFDAPFPFPAGVTGLPAGDIQTPVLQSILDYQDFEPQVSTWMYVFIGRLLYELGEKDNWQVLPFCMGMAQSGKSTLLLKVCANFFESCDVGVLSNNIEKKFGISGFYDKSLFVAPEINQSMQLDQAEFQSLVSGDMMQIAKKHRDPQTVAWKVPGILAGNQMPGWRDTAGSIIRRIVVFNFVKSVVEVDTQLGSKLEKEVPKLLVKCNKAYLEHVGRINSQNIWKCLPEYFLRTSQDLQECVNSLLSFMNGGDLTYAHDLYMPWNAFHQRYREYCHRHALHPVSFTKSSEHTLNATLAKKKCTKYVSSKEEDLPYPPRELEHLRNPTVNTVWLKGADLTDNC